MESDDENQESFQWSGANGCILLVDVSSDMWEDRGNEIPVEIALRACATLLRQIMISAPKQLFGVSLYGTQKNINGLENVVELIKLEEPTVDAMKTIIEISSNPNIIKDKWGVFGNYNLADALWQATRVFSGCKKKITAQTVTMLSCLTEPDANNHRAILKKASDLSTLGIDLNIINISDKKIPSDSFFMELGKVISDQPSLEWEPPAPSMVVEDIVPLMWQNNHRKSASALLKFHLGPGVELGVGLYYLCRSKEAPKKVLLCRKTNETVESSSALKRQSDTTAAPILRSELCMYQQFGDKNIEFTCSEVTELKKFAGPPMIKLLGFKPSSVLNKSKCYLKPCTFLYSDEKSVTGSNQLLLCLRDRCLAKDRVAICTMVSRWYSHPKLVALVPQKKIMKGSYQIQPDGFHVIYLPYVDDLKEVIVNGITEPSMEQLNCVENIVGKLTDNEYKNGLIKNPKLETLHTAIETLALDEENPRPVQDLTIPDADKLSEKVEDLNEDFENLFGPFGVAPAKRTRSDNKPAKKIATDIEPPDIKLLKSRIEGETVAMYTVAQLKDILKWKQASGLPAMTGIKKDKLVELVYEHCQDI